jgi:hypothetical protein
MLPRVLFVRFARVRVGDGGEDLAALFHPGACVRSVFAVNVSRVQCDA